MTSLTREQILACQDIKIEEVQVPEWGGGVFVKSLTGKELDLYQDGIVKMRGKDVQGINYVNMRSKLVAMALCDAEGKRLFSETDVETLAAKSAGALNRVFLAAQRISGLDKTEVEDISKN